MPAALLLLAEVADKEGPLWIPWLYTGVLAVLAYRLVRWRQGSLWVMLPLTAAWAMGLVDSATEPHWLPALLEELGLDYVASQLAPTPLALLAAVAPVVRADLPAARAWWASRRSRAPGAVEPYRGATPAAPPTAFPTRLAVVSVAVAAVLASLAALALSRIAAARAGHAP